MANTTRLCPLVVPVKTEVPVGMEIRRLNKIKIREDDHGPEVRPERLGVEKEAVLSVCLGSLWPSDLCEEKGEACLANVARCTGKVEERGRDGISACGEEVCDDEREYVCD